MYFANSSYIHKSARLYLFETLCRHCSDFKLLTSLLSMCAFAFLLSNSLFRFSFCLLFHFLHFLNSLLFHDSFSENLTCIGFMIWKDKWNSAVYMHKCKLHISSTPTIDLTVHFFPPMVRDCQIIYTDLHIRTMFIF